MIEVDGEGAEGAAARRRVVIAVAQQRQPALLHRRRLFLLEHPRRIIDARHLVGAIVRSTNRFSHAAASNEVAHGPRRIARHRAEALVEIPLELHRDTLVAD